MDNMLITRPNPDQITQIKEALKSQFEIDDIGPATYFVGMRIIRNRAKRSITLIQDAYINKILKKYRITHMKLVATPMAAGALNLIVSNTTYQATKADIKEYQSKIGSATYLAIQTKADIMYTCSVLSRFLSNPLKDHLDIVNQLLWYILGSINLGIMYSGNTLKKDPQKGTIHGYSDSDFVGDIKARKSTSGYAFFFVEGVILV